jgi:hypothetical protein
LIRQFQIFGLFSSNGDHVGFDPAFDFEFRSGRSRLCAAENGSEVNVV